MSNNQILIVGFVAGLVIGLMGGSGISDADREIYTRNAIYDNSIYEDINKTRNSNDYKIWAFKKDLQKQKLKDKI